MTPRWTAALITTLTLLTAAPAALAHAESATAEASAAIHMTDDLGRAVTLDAPARRVAVASPAAVDLLLSIGVRPVTRPWMAGATPDSWQGIPTIGYDHASGPNLEQLIAARPDLVVIGVTSARFIDRIESLVRAPVLVLQVSDVEDLPARLVDLGRLTDTVEPARARADELRRILEAQRAHHSSSPPRVFALFGGPRTGYAFTDTSYFGSLIELVGGQVVTASGKPHGLFPELARYSVERLWAADPDVILVLSHGSVHDRLPELASDPAWASLRAVREGRVVTLSDELFVMRPGAEVIEALGVLRAAVAPANRD